MRGRATSESIAMRQQSNTAAAILRGHSTPFVIPAKAGIQLRLTRRTARTINYTVTEMKAQSRSVTEMQSRSWGLLEGNGAVLFDIVP